MLDIKALLIHILNTVYPIGSYLHTSDGDFNPNTDIGGTWELMGEGQVLLAGSKSGTYQVGNQYGDNTHILTTDEIPAHTHGNKSLTGQFYNRRYGTSGTGTDIVGITPGGITSKNVETWSGSHAMINIGGRNQSNQLYDKIIVDASHEHDSVGDGQAHSIMQLSTAVYIWHRTA